MNISTNQFINQPIKQVFCEFLNQQTGQPINQEINQSTNQPITQSRPFQSKYLSAVLGMLS